MLKNILLFLIFSISFPVLAGENDGIFHSENNLSYQSFWGREIPKALRQLIEFEIKYSAPKSYSAMFSLESNHSKALDTWSKKESFHARLLPFAYANASGSFYAVWSDGTSKSLDLMPVVVFGDEGGSHVVASDFVDFLRLLTYDCAITVNWDEAYFFKSTLDNENRHTKDSQLFVSWLKTNFNHQPIFSEKETKYVMNLAKTKYQFSFDSWLEQHVEE